MLGPAAFLQDHNVVTLNLLLLEKIKSFLGWKGCARENETEAPFHPSQSDLI